MITTHDRHGCYHGLLLQHRYEEQRINFHALLGPDDFQQRPCALWDFLQNYMDTSGPIIIRAPAYQASGNTGSPRLSISRLAQAKIAMA
ncbi:hypothetical protein CTI50_25155 [Pseudomonas syringae pv. actinidiae]|nr:hypothetical protein B1F85_18435 [Pseudomonas syringae pv. actinidiae]AYL81102.1 hypothetical protein CN228_15140 [Pseudomonas syringae pv. actinidiae str. Shaanxi_M228]NAS90993.1 hypothetical protein [Pseudomonas syringae pv. actinidiae]PHZ38845.1 hypothetical protein CS297_24525 [Pseudomonas syringae pv. actinidiae]PIB86155.1 hypothetical protein CS296_19670 [Pseudomonas syringae pv. actinidiae]